jgi:exopolysaccharide production protein ExoZ
VQSASNRFVSIQYLRALAATLVAIQHANSGPIHIDLTRLDLGRFGVNLFFVISGYIMWATTAAARRSPRQFWMARIIRIVPLYWIFTSLYLAIFMLHPAALNHPSNDLIHIVKSYAFVPAVHPLLQDIVPVYSLGWTLNYEMFFYAAFGIALFIANRGARLAIVTLMLGGLVAAGFAWRPTGPILHTYTSELFLEFLCGTLIAAAGDRLIASGPRAAIPILGVAALLLAATYSGKLGGSYVLMYGLPAALTVAGLLALEHALRIRPSNFALLVGDASYSLYLCHPFAQRAVYLALPTAAAASSRVIGLICIAVASMAAILCAIAVYRFVEQPMLVGLRRLSDSGGIEWRWQVGKIPAR